LYPYATLKFAGKIEPFLNFLKNHEISTYWRAKEGNSKINYDPRENHISISTPESGKGLEWDIVFMPSIEQYRQNSLRFVSATRAHHILYPSTCESLY